jgi:hypothetical protein
MLSLKGQKCIIFTCVYKYVVPKGTIPAGLVLICNMQYMNVLSRVACPFRDKIFIGRHTSILFSPAGTIPLGQDILRMTETIF